MPAAHCNDLPILRLADPAPVQFPSHAVSESTDAPLLRSGVSPAAEKDGESPDESLHRSDPSRALHSRYCLLVAKGNRDIQQLRANHSPMRSRRKWRAELPREGGV